MPAYEFICDKCHQSFSVQIPYTQYGQRAVICPHCGSRAVTRRIGKVRLSRSEGTRRQGLEDLADERMLSNVDAHPAEAGRLMRRMSRESGAEMGESFDEVVDRLEHGQTTADIEKDMPDPD